MCVGVIQDLPFVEKIFKGTKSLVVRNDCIQRFDVHSEDETMVTSEAKVIQYGQHVARVLHVAIQSSYKRCCNLVQV